MRLDRPIGAWLLFWPCLWPVLLLAPAQTSGEILRLVLLFGAGAVIMRGAGCVLNDILDADLDAKVARTAGRPIPSGQVTRGRALVFLALLLLAGLAVLLQFGWLTILWGAASLLLVAPYPLMKRITWWPQAWLGLTFNYGALLGWAEVYGALTWHALALYAAGLFWTLGYDTIYAIQDKVDDAAAGIRSSALALGGRVRVAVGLFYALALALLALTMGWVGAAALIPAALHLGWQTLRVKPDDSALALRLFRANREAGGLIALACLIAGLGGFRPPG